MVKQHVTLATLTGHIRDFITTDIGDLVLDNETSDEELEYNYRDFKETFGLLYFLVENYYQENKDLLSNTNS